MSNRARSSAAADEAAALKAAAPTVRWNARRLSRWCTPAVGVEDLEQVGWETFLRLYRRGSKSIDPNYRSRNLRSAMIKHLKAHRQSPNAPARSSGIRVVVVSFEALQEEKFR